MTNRTAVLNSPFEHVARRLGEAEVVSDPYPHFFLENLFPGEFYRELLDRLPSRDAYQNLFEITTLKLDHFRFRDQRDLADGWINSLPQELKAFWETFNSWFLSPELATAVLRSFAGPMQRRFGSEDNWPEVSVEVQLIRHEAGYFLQPHSDANSKLVVLLIYLPQDASGKHLGTSIYQPRDRGFTCPASKHHPFEDFNKVWTAPYLPNSVLAFARSDCSFHGVEPMGPGDVADGNRDLIQYVLYDRAAREQQLLARRRAAASGSAE